jgi:hypothetical protein
VRSRAGSGDRGVYAILYAVTMTLFIAFGAIVVDLSSARQDRRIDRLGADAAALAGADQLALDARDPYAGCQRAWSYLDANLPSLDPPAVDPCAAFLPFAGVQACTLAPLPLTSPAGDYTVTITWPVADLSDLLTKPALRPGSVSQSLVPAVDGDDPCARMGVEVTREREFIFGAVVGGPTRIGSAVHSVARATPDILSALHVLDPAACQALTTSDGTSLRVRRYAYLGDRPGAITVESTGDGCESGYVVQPSAAAGSHICVDGPGPDDGPYPDCNGNGLIRMRALNPSGGNPLLAFDPGLPESVLAPTPQALIDERGSRPVTDIHGCATSPPSVSCTTTPNHVSALVAALGGTGLPIPYQVVGYGDNDGSAFRELPDPALVPGFDDCSPGDVSVPRGNWFVNCPDSNGFVASGTVVFEGGTIVFAGGAAADGGCLAFNVPSASCPSGEPAPGPGPDTIVYLRDDHLTQRNSGTLLLPRTVVFIRDGHVQLEGGGRLFWTAPTADGCNGNAACEAARFTKIALWSEGGGAEPNLLRGQDELTLTGVYFAPQARFVVDQPSGFGDCVLAQLWVASLSVEGGGQLDLCPNRNTAILEQRHGSVLIR